jgi:hypothetical protein
MLNRTPIIVRPKQPFIDWATKASELDEDAPRPEEVEEALLKEPPSVYLIPEVEDRSVLEETMSDFCELIFEAELEAWMTDIGSWPAQRDWDTFREWFDWQALDGVFDTFEHELTLE